MQSLTNLKEIHVVPLCVSCLGSALTLVLLRQASQVVGGLEAAPEDLQVLDGLLTGDLEGIGRGHVGLGVDLNTDEDAVIERVGTLHLPLALYLIWRARRTHLVRSEGDLRHGNESVADEVANGVILGANGEDLSVGSTYTVVSTMSRRKEASAYGYRARARPSSHQASGSRTRDCGAKVSNCAHEWKNKQ